MKKNIKQLVWDSGFPYWRVADRIGVCEQTVSNWLRHPTDEQAQKIMTAIDALKQEVDHV